MPFLLAPIFNPIAGTLLLVITQLRRTATMQRQQDRNELRPALKLISALAQTAIAGESNSYAQTPRMLRELLQIDRPACSHPARADDRSFWGARRLWRSAHEA